MARAQQLVSQLLEGADDIDPAAELGRFVDKQTPKFPDYNRLIQLADQYEIYINGCVTRDHSRYYHERSTDFTLDIGDIPEEVYNEVDTLAAKVEQQIKDEIVVINKKIYRALEREYDYQNSDEVVDGNIEANEYTFNELGEFLDPAGGANVLHFGDLDDAAKERARAEWRDSATFDNWYDNTLDEWMLELEGMGFETVEINFTGFASQGDGASFTAKRFNFRKWANWFFEGKHLERGHPYTDDLPAQESIDPQPYIDALPQVQHPETLRLLSEWQDDPTLHTEVVTDSPEVVLVEAYDDMEERVVGSYMFGSHEEARAAVSYCMQKMQEAVERGASLHDTPDDFDVQQHLLSPVARMAKTAGFEQNDRDNGEERWVKKLSTGGEAWLRRNRWRDGEEPQPVPQIPSEKDYRVGEQWELVLIKPGKRPEQLAYADERTMNYLLGAFLQRIATLPKGKRLPKPEDAD